MERPRELSGTLFDRASSTYALVGPDFFTTLAERLIEHAPISARLTMIDVGAGTGAVTRAAAERLGPDGSVLAVDLAPQMLGQFRQRLEGSLPVQLTTAVMDASHLGIATGSFDVAVSGIAVQSMRDPRGAVAEMCRVLRPGGTFGISISKGWWWQEDPRWSWHADLLESIGVAVTEPPPSSGAAFVEELLSGQPLTDVVRSREVLQFEFVSADIYLEWCWSHGWRGVMEELSFEQLSMYRSGIITAFTAAGTVPGQLVTHLVTARRA
jgi:ubiquinone/menaquinone biosynthesis C-methylase UbiE